MHMILRPINKILHNLVIRSLLTLIFAASMQYIDIAYAEDASGSILRDVNGDGKVSILAFGDSITYGVGDGVNDPNDGLEGLTFTDGTLGYPKRLTGLLSVPVKNTGVPGENLATDGLRRLPTTIGGSDADFVVLLEGINDARSFLSNGTYEMILQKAINVVSVFGKVPVLMTMPSPCCDHEFLNGIALGYSDVVRRVAPANQLKYADLSRSWITTCVDKARCELYNLPEGLHPNPRGYTVMAQTIASTFLDIDIFAANGAADLAAATGVDPGKIIVKPDVAAAEVQ